MHDLSTLATTTLAATLTANAYFLAVVIVVAATLITISNRRNIRAEVGKVKLTVDEINHAVNNVDVGVPPIKDNAFTAAAASTAAVTRMSRLETQQAATFNRLDRIDSRLDGHSVHFDAIAERLGGLGGRVSDIATSIGELRETSRETRDEARDDRKGQVT